MTGEKQLCEGQGRAFQARGPASAEAWLPRRLPQRQGSLPQRPITFRVNLRTQPGPGFPLASPNLLPGTSTASWNPPEGHTVPAPPRLISFSASDPQPGLGCNL